MRRERRGTINREACGPSPPSLIYAGLDGTLRETPDFEPSPSPLTGDDGVLSLHLRPAFTPISLDHRVRRAEPPAVAAPSRPARATANRKPVAQRGHVETSNDIFNEMLCRSTSDLDMLITETPQGLTPMPAFPGIRPRSAATASSPRCRCCGRPADRARRAAPPRAFQARPSIRADAEPGKILHEMRDGEMAALGEVPFGHYYGSVDATPLFVLLAGLYVERTGDLATLVELWPAIEAALAWIDGPGDPDGDGFVEYHRATEDGLANQGWKDSHDSIFHADGHPPLARSRWSRSRATSTRQAPGGALRRVLAHARRATGSSPRPICCERFEEAFWCEDLGTYALALDGKSSPAACAALMPVRCCSPALPRRSARRGRRRLLRPDFFSGWGIRTIAGRERATIRCPIITARSGRTTMR